MNLTLYLNGTRNINNHKKMRLLSMKALKNLSYDYLSCRLKSINYTTNKNELKRGIHNCM